MWTRQFTIAAAELDAPNRDAVERHHSKFGIKCGWITQVKMIAEYDISDVHD
jgi:hypothetical protein